MNAVQIIEKDGRAAFYVVPAEIWEKVSGLVEDAADRAAFDQAVADDSGERLPGAVAFAIADGEHPVRAWRKHRGFSQETLARQAGISKPFVSQIEKGQRTGTADTLKKLAQTLGVPAGALIL